jgi:hypothetical protein
MGPDGRLVVTQPVDSSILHEIVRVVESRRKVPERVQVRAREYLITYLEDHQRRLEEALQRYDSDRLNMLYGQLASKIKYQLLRRLPGSTAAAATKQAKGKQTVPQKPKPKPKLKPKPKPRPKAKPKAKVKARTTSKATQKPKAKKAKAGKSSPKTNRGATGRARSASARSARGKTAKPQKRVAARKSTPQRAGKRERTRNSLKK